MVGVAGDLPVAPTATRCGAECYQWRVYTGGVGAQYVINGGLYRQCRGEWKLARVASAVSVGYVADCGVGVAGDLPVAPTATR